MKNSFFVFFIFLFSNCQSYKEDELVIQKIEKICPNDEDLINHQMCNDWDILSSNQIKNIVNSCEEGYFPQNFNLIDFYGLPDDNIFITATIKENNKEYDLLVGSTSWFVKTNTVTREEKFYLCKNPDIQKYFLDNFFSKKSTYENPELRKRYNKNKEIAITNIYNKNSLNLPFCSQDYFTDYFSSSIDMDRKYPSIKVDNIIIDYLKTIDYEGESYIGYVIDSTNFYHILINMQRGDSEYFITLTLDKNLEIIDWILIGESSLDNFISFCIDENRILTKKSENLLPIKYKANDKGNFIKID